MGSRKRTLKHSRLQVPHGVVEIVEDLAGGAAERPAQHAVLEEAPRDFLDQADAEDVVGADAPDPLQIAGVGLQDAPQGAEFPERPAGRLLAIPAGRAQGQQKLDDLVIQEGVQPGLQEFLPQPPPVPVPIVVRVGLGAGRRRPRASAVAGADGRRMSPPLPYRPGPPQAIGYRPSRFPGH